MNDEEAKPVNGTADAVAPKFQLMVTWNADDSMSVTGPMENEMIFDFLLKKASEMATAFRAEQAQKRIEIASPTLLGRLKQLAPVRRH